MAEQSFILPKSLSREMQVARIARVLAALGLDRAWRIEIHEHKAKRSDAQNRYLWGAVYPTIIKSGNLQGWNAEDVHEYFLGEHFGWEMVEGLGRRRMKPIRRSSKLSKLEFMDYVAFIQRRAAEFGVYIADPNEVAA